MTRLQDGGLAVPDDIAVVGWDDVMTARYVRPGLTTVRQPVRELGALAAERLHERVTGSRAARASQVLPTELVLRSSCGCLRPATTPSHAPRPVRAHSRSPSGRRSAPPGRRHATNPTPPPKKERPDETHLRHGGRHPDAAAPHPVRLRPRQRLRRCRARPRARASAQARPPAPSRSGPWAPRARSCRPSPSSSRPPTRAPRSSHRHPVGRRPRQVHHRDHGQHRRRTRRWSAPPGWASSPASTRSTRRRRRSTSRIFFEGAQKTTEVSGTSYGIPWYVETRLVYYRTDLAKKAGFDARRPRTGRA